MYIRKIFIIIYIVSIVIIINFVFRSSILRLIKFNGEDKYLLEVYIPRIKLQEVVYNIDSSLNNVDLHVEILDESDLDSNLFFLAAHSGSGRASYFDNLVYLEKGDIIWIFKDEKKYCFVVEELFYIQKNGYLRVDYSSKDNMLFLITCSLKYVDKQLVVRSKLIYEC